MAKQKGFGTVETVKVEDGKGGYKIINKEDQKKSDKLYKEPEAPKEG